MMSNRPLDPKNARNKNVLVVGGSGSGKTRFCHSFTFFVFLVGGTICNTDTSNKIRAVFKSRMQDGTVNIVVDSDEPNTL